ncbi:MAG: ATP-binding protein, partial [Fulvivirga sp.]|uniref:sensor histidine kinase n=1 Tax=Fulvivirga sp. TaxID=1931237 RepID=UPI0032EC902F
VMDQGPGVAKEEQDKLFQKFSKLSARPTGGESSTGLGLSLVKRYAELIEANVWYEDRSDYGAVFVVEFKPIKK